MKRIKKLQLVLLLSAIMIVLPLLIVPISSEPATEVEREKDKCGGYYFKIHGSNLPLVGYGVANVIYKNLSPNIEQSITIEYEYYHYTAGPKTGLYGPTTINPGEEKSITLVQMIELGTNLYFTLIITAGSETETFSSAIQIPPSGQ